MNLSGPELDQIVANRLRVEREAIAKEIEKRMEHPFVTGIERLAFGSLLAWVIGRDRGR